MTAETERVAEGDADLGPPRHVGHIIQVAVGVGMLVVDRRRNDAFSRASTQIAASTPPAAPRRWPVMDLVELTASR